VPIEKLKRVMLHLRELSYPAKEFYSLKEVRHAIDEEIGYTDKAFKRAIKALKRQGWLKRVKRWHFVDIEYSPLSDKVASSVIHKRPESLKKQMARGAREEEEAIAKENAKRKLHSDDETMDEFMSHI